MREAEISAVVARLMSARESFAPDAAAATAVGEIMQRDVVCVPPDLDLDRLVALLVEHGIGGAPVVDEGRPIGVVSKTDVVRVCSESRPRSNVRVRDIMMPLSFKLTESASISQAAALMAYEGVHRVVIVGMAGDVVGILSSLDVLRWVAQHSGYVVPG